MRKSNLGLLLLNICTIILLFANRNICHNTEEKLNRLQTQTDTLFRYVQHRDTQHFRDNVFFTDDMREIKQTIEKLKLKIKNNGK